jgi:glycosyltransferase involved in cell wall biosynthesis
MSRVLLVTESPRSIGEFRRPWVRALYRRYVEGYQRAVTRAVWRLARSSEVVLLAGREFVTAAALPREVEVHYYDEESYKVDSEALAALTHRLASGWWPAPATEPGLVYRDVWLPALLPVAKGLLIRLEVVESLGVVERLLDQVKPERVLLATGASIAERVARLLGGARSLPVSVATRFLPAYLVAAAYRALFRREERKRLATLLEHPRRPLAVALPEAEGPRILLSTCRSRHLYVVEPLVAALSVAGARPRVLASTDEEAEMNARLGRLGRAGVPCAYFMDYLSREDALRLVRDFRPRFRRLWRRLVADPEFHRRLEWGGASLSPVVAPFLRDAVERSLLSALLFLEAAFRALEASSPEAVIISNERRYAERALALAARARGIPTILFFGAALLGRDRINLFDIEDRILVMGDHVRAALAAQGIDPQRIVVVGDPRSIAARLVPPARLREEVFRDFNLVPDRPLLVLVSKYVSLLFSIQEKEALYRTVSRAVGLLGNPNVIVKVHPNENLDTLRDQVRTWGWAQAILTQDYDIHRLFGAADAAIMVTSMAGVEAMAMGCPVVAVQTSGKDFEGEYMLPYVSEGAALRVEMGDSEALAEALRTLLADAEARTAAVERGRAFVARYLHSSDAELGDRLLDVVDEMRREIVPGGAR